MVYVNKFWITYRSGEFYIKLIRESPDGEKEVGEIYTTPKEAKTLMRILEMLVKEYEEKFGMLPGPELLREECRKDYTSPYVS
ncbi:MAG: DUF3467 domain-containing protein [Candidatus Bathyarchaeota archaeon]|nr:DUF3467 domain-containing protein [Candidatus Bathyarchaeota archaeon]